jgi:hypothetical protein
MNAVVDGVIALDVPAIVVLVHAVAVNPENRGMLDVFVDVLRNEEPAGNLLAVGTGIVDKFGFDELRAVNSSGHRVSEANGL